MKTRTSALKALLLVLFGCVIALVLAELGIRILTWSLDRQPLLMRSEVTGWRLKPNLDGVRAYRNGDFFITTDANGFRRTRPSGAPFNDDARSIILLGDSFVQGLGVGDSDTFGWIVAEETSREVVNLGVLGFGTGQALRALAAYLQSHPTRGIGDVVLFVFENDFREIQLPYAYGIGRTRPMHRIVDGTLHATPYEPRMGDHLMDISQLYWLVSSKLPMLFAPSDPSPADGVDLVLACVDRMRQLVAARGGRFHLLAHREPLWSGAARPSWWETFVARSGATDITDAIHQADDRSLIGFDGIHWNAAGHRLVASILLQQLGV